MATIDTNYIINNNNRNNFNDHNNDTNADFISGRSKNDYRINNR